MQLQHMNARLKWQRIFNPNAKLPETRDEAEKWADLIELDLSPENLHCDGEISAAAANRKGRALKAEVRELLDLVKTFN